MVNENCDRYIARKTFWMVKNVFTAAQLEIISTPPGHTVVYAAPGSGKTTVLTHHIAEQLQKRRFRPNEIMAITFTRQSAIDMKRRMIEQNGVNRKAIEALQIGTFHAQLFRFLLKSLSDIPVLLSATEQYEMMKLAIERYNGIRMRISGAQVQRLLTSYSLSRASYPPKRLFRQDGRIINTYIKLKERLCRWDFDDIMHAFCERIESYDDSSSFIRELAKIRYLLVDEYQDTNSIQWAIVSQVVSKLQIPIFVVGDDDQSIYGFRGASPQFLLSFCSVYEDAQQFTLDENFRSSPEIVKHARSLIEHNLIRTDKQMKPAKRNPGLVKAYLVSDEEAEARCVFNSLMKIKQSHPEWTCAVLSRTRRQLYKVWGRIRGSALKGIELHTFHDAKGREWDSLFIVGLVENNPYLARNVEDTQDYEEERRLYYVALTRAKVVSYTFMPQRIAGQLVRPCPFVHEARISVESLVKKH